MIKIQLLGAAGEVTGSSYLVTTKDKKILVDFGLHQGNSEDEARNRDKLPLKPAELDCVVLTHAHLDHSGRLPLLIKQGFKGPIYCTEPTVGLANLILSDSAYQQQNQVDRDIRDGKLPANAEPLYTMSDVADLISFFEPLPYESEREISPGIKITFRDAGHILGSSSIQMTVKQNGQEKIIVFSGDIGQYNMAIHPDPQPFTRADLVFLESTYGDRDHQSLSNTLREFEQVLVSTIKRGGKILIPAFAVGRTQQLIYYLREMISERRIKPVPIYIDSPMATKATKIYVQNLELFDRSAQKIINRALPGDVRFVESAEESKKLNDLHGPFVVIAGAGMCTGGRIVHHLRHNLRDPKNSVVICGYQAVGTLGRRLVERHREVKIFGEFVPLNAEIHTIGGFSAHAGQSELVKWFEALAGSRPKLVLTHGEDRQREALSVLLQSRTGVKAFLPKRFDTVEL